MEVTEKKSVGIIWYYLRKRERKGKVYKTGPALKLVMRIALSGVRMAGMRYILCACQSAVQGVKDAWVMRRRCVRKTKTLQRMG